MEVQATLQYRPLKRAWHRFRKIIGRPVKPEPPMSNILFGYADIYLAPGASLADLGGQPIEGCRWSGTWADAGND